MHTFGLTERDRAQSRAAGFEALAAVRDPVIIAPDPLNRYAQSALATWYARQQQVRFAAGAGAVPPAITEDAETIKKVLGYYFDEHAQYSLDLQAIRAGQGYQDTANDLQQLADLYEVPEVAAKVTRDSEHYRDTDVRDARAVAGEIFRALGFETTGAAEWTARVHRAYTHLTDSYREHCYVGRLLFFRSEDVTLTYPPSRVSVVRLPRGHHQHDVTVDGDTEEDAGTDASGGPVRPGT